MSTSDTSTPANVVVTHSASSVPSKCTLLSTAIVFMQNKNGSQHYGRALLDSGSQASFITKEFLNKLDCSPRKVDIAISSISGSTTRSTQSVQIKLCSRLNSFSVLLDCIVTDRITDDLPAFTMKRSAFNIPHNIQLADPKFNVSSKIDILIGAEAFWNLICIGQIRASDKHPTLQKTRLGWILAGNLNYSPLNSQRVQSLCISVSNSELHDQLNKFWQLEDVGGNHKSYTREERLCEKHFLDTVTRNPHGRYVVQLPLKPELIDNLGNSRDIALKRLHGLEKRFRRDPSLKRQYSEFIHEYLTLGHMRPIVEDPNEIAYYMPHHGVLKEDAKSTKLRVVFYASCKTYSGLSLNDFMMVGPVVQDDLTSILLRFRTFRYVLVADIIKMYRQVLMHLSQMRLQRIL